MTFVCIGSECVFKGALKKKYVYIKIYLRLAAVWGVGAGVAGRDGVAAATVRAWNCCSDLI